MRKIPEIRVVGDAPVVEKDKAAERIRQSILHSVEALSPKLKEKLEQFETPSTEIEQKIFSFANDHTNRLMDELGLDYYDIPLGNYHMIDADLQRDVAKIFIEEKDNDNDDNEYLTDAVAHSDYQMIVFSTRLRESDTNMIDLATTAIHETLHLKAYLALHAKGKTKAAYRMGVSTYSPLGFNESEHFGGLHEAIVEHQSALALDDVLKMPELVEQKNILQNKIDEALAGEDPREQIFAYQEQRQALSYICEKISDDNPDKYPSPSAVFTQFLKAHFTGDLLTVGRLVEQSFGRGSFRVLGEMTVETDDALVKLELLSEMRRLRHQVA